MGLEPMQNSELRESLSKLYHDDQQRVLVITTSGKALAGHISGEAYARGGPIPPGEACFDESGRLLLHHFEMENEHIIYIPPDEIAGIGPLPYNQVKDDSEDTTRSHFNYWENSLRKDYFELTKEMAEQRGYEIEQIDPEYDIRTVDESFEWGEIRFEDDVLLYGDFEYFEAEGGITSVGLGAFGISISGGRDRDLRDAIENKIVATKTPISDLQNVSSATVSGHVSVLVTSEDDYVERVAMEGTDWIPSVVTEQKTPEDESITGSEWCICYLSEPDFMFPIDQWDNVEDKLRIFGEVVHTARKTPWGTADCFLKARAAGYRSDDDDGWL